MQDALKVIIEIQEMDMKMIRLMKLKRERQKELGQIEQLRSELQKHSADKGIEIKELNLSIAQHELKLQEIMDKLKKLETQQLSLKKADEFNALTLETSAAEREKTSLENKISDLVDKKLAEEELFDTIKKSLAASAEDTATLEKEISNSITLINAEGSSLKSQRDHLTSTAEPELLKIYDRLLKNKKDRVVVAIENRTCSGCHIALTAQHENLVRKGINLTFCEHCSRIHYWAQLQEAEDADGSANKRRRRRRTTTA